MQSLDSVDLSRVIPKLPMVFSFLIYVLFLPSGAPPRTSSSGDHYEGTYDEFNR